MSRTAPSKPAPVASGGGRNRNLALICFAVFFGMIGAAYAAVPLYRAFCQATGFDGATRRAETASTVVSARSVTVRFDANLRDLPWDFTAEQTAQEVKLGETKLAFFKVTNSSAKPVTARAVFNVVPESAGPYFKKLQCFCFTDQTVQPHQTVEMPVLYFVDPKFGEDPETKGKQEITLSYTFYPATDVPKS